MKNTYRPLVLFAFVLYATFLSAQVHQQNLSIKKTSTNFQFPITLDYESSEFSPGIELAYGISLDDRFGLVIPFKFAVVELPIDDRGNVMDNQRIASLDLMARGHFLSSEYMFQPYFTFGVGSMLEIDNGNDWNPEIPFGFGLNIRVVEGLYLSGESQYRASFDGDRNQLQHSFGLTFLLGEPKEKEPEITDTDNDGIPDEEDDCPTEPGPAEFAGCPDTDGDGIIDKMDDCPDTPGLPEFAGCPDTDGDMIPDPIDDCPDEPGIAEKNGCPENDRDSDGIVDENDECPDEAGPASTNGCPDQDGDGVADKVDKCPTEPGLPKFEGCPDSDGDGIVDASDRCPDKAGPASNSGCPELEKEEKDVLEFAMKAVQFETGSAKLKPASTDILNQIADIMRKYPEQKLRISGHTDSIGSEAANQSLSEKRAKSCYDFLVNAGIPATRMSHQGFGESQPIADNQFAPGGEQNRRVEFDIYVE